MNKTIKYTLKIWATTLVIAPVFIVLFGVFRNSRAWDDLAYILGIYIWIIVLGFIGSCATWAMFVTGVYSILKWNITEVAHKSAIQFFGALLTLSTILLFFAILDSFSVLYTKTFWMFAGPYIVCLAASIQFYKVPQLYIDNQQNSTT
jgi:hypothetical protein